MRSLFIFTALSTVFFLPISNLSLAQTASFNCSQAKKVSEIAVCNSPGLSRMDKELALLYRSHLKDYKNDPNNHWC